MKIVSTMLSGNESDKVAAAVRSVIDWVDCHILIDTGITDDTIDVVRKIAKDKLVIRKFEWCRDFAKARNFSLECAADAGGDWALTIDTDERVDFGMCDSRQTLNKQLSSDPEVKLWLVEAGDRSYAKERFIRVPTKMTWAGRTHEALVGYTAPQRKTLENVYFGELGKNEAQLSHKLERDLRILLEETNDDPGNRRWWYFLGKTYSMLKQHENAYQAYQRCFQIKTHHNEKAAWAAYQAVGCLFKMGRYEEGIEVATYGMSLDPKFPELAYYAGHCCYKLQRFHDAISWCQMAVAIGSFEGSDAGKSRVSFRYLGGWYEAPFDVMRFAYKRLGDEENAAVCTEKFKQAKAKRLARKR